MKAIALWVHGKCRRTHDLKLLWNNLPRQHHAGIEQAARQLLHQTRGTRLEDGALTDIEQIREVVNLHRRTFVDARYYNETQQRPSLKNNIQLWNLVLATLMHAKSI